MIAADDRFLGKDGVECSIHFGGTIKRPELRAFPHFGRKHDFRRFTCIYVNDSRTSVDSRDKIRAVCSKDVPPPISSNREPPLEDL